MTKYRAYVVSDLEFVNTGESYSRNILIGNNTVVVPYINIGLLPSNPINNIQSVIDFSFYALRGVASITLNYINQKISFDWNFAEKRSDLIEEYISFGGFNNQSGVEAKVVCEETLLFVNESARFNISTQPFIPFNTPVYKQNMESFDVNSFFSSDNLPEEINELIGINSFSLV